MRCSPSASWPHPGPASAPHFSCRTSRPTPPEPCPPVRTRPCRSQRFSSNAPGSALLLLNSFRGDRINDQLEPGRDGLLPVALLVFSVPDRKGDRLHATGPERGVVVGIPRLH